MNCAGWVRRWIRARGTHELSGAKEDDEDDGRLFQSSAHDSSPGQSSALSPRLLRPIRCLAIHIPGSSTEMNVLTPKGFMNFHASAAQTTQTSWGEFHTSRGIFTAW